MVINRVPTRQNPKLFDKLIAELQKGLADNLPWLTYSFGKAERLVKSINGKRYYSPNVYVGNNEYMDVTPDEVFGNYSFFVLHEPQRISCERGERNEIVAPYSLIVWVDMRKVEPSDERNTEAVKQSILRTLNGMIFPKQGHFSVTKIYERAEKVFEGFTLDEVDNQYLMHPYAGFRFDGEMQIEDECIL